MSEEFIAAAERLPSYAEDVLAKHFSRRREVAAAANLLRQQGALPDDNKCVDCRGIIDPERLAAIEGEPFKRCRRCAGLPPLKERRKKGK